MNSTALFFRRRLPILLLAGLGLFAAAARAEVLRQTWLLLHTETQESMFVTDPAEESRLVKAGWKINGTAYLRGVAQPGTLGVHRLVRWDGTGNDRIFATRPEEVTRALGQGYHDEGTLGDVAVTEKSGLIPVYIFTKGTKHLWLIDKSEQSWAEKNGWKPGAAVAFWLWPLSATP